MDYGWRYECFTFGSNDPIQILGKVGSEEIPDIRSIAPDDEIGYMLEVDLKAPIQLHDFLADYPLAPENR